MTFFYRRPERRVRPRTLASARPRQPVQLQVERLEDRDVPAQVFAITAPAGGLQNLITFDTSTPGAVNTVGVVTGTGAGETVVGMDIRPSNGLTYIVTSAGGTGRLYTLNPATAVAARVGAGVFPMLGTAFGVDVNPVPDALRIVSNIGLNLRVNLNTGNLINNDTTLSYAATDPGAGSTPNLVASGYTNNMAGATATVLYGIDSARDQLVVQGSAATGGPNGGVLFSQGALGFDTTDQVSLDIQASNMAFASLTSTAAGTTNSTLVTIDLTSGRATTVGTIGNATTGLIQAMAVVPANITNPNLNQLVIANLQAVFAQPLPPQIALAVITRIADVNGDGFADVTAFIGIRVIIRGRRAIQLFSLTFDGVSPSGGLIGTPVMVGII